MATSRCCCFTGEQLAVTDSGKPAVESGLLRTLNLGKCFLWLIPLWGSSHWSQGTRTFKMTDQLSATLRGIFS